MRPLTALAIVMLLSTVHSAHAQPPTVVAVDFDRATLSWTLGVGGDPATETLVKCGAATGQYTIEKAVPLPATSIAVKDVISIGGSYFCAAQARNEFGVSGLSNEIAFRAGRAPGPPSGFVLTAK